MEDKSQFKMEIDTPFPIPRTVTRNFTSLKHLRQWQKRNDLDNVLWCFAHREYILNDTGDYERFTVISNQIVRLSELEKLLKKLKNEGFKSSLYKQ